MFSEKKRYNYWIIGILAIIGIHLYLLTKLVFFPYPELFIYSYLTSKGLLPYKQILDQHFPGLMFFPINLYTLGMETPEVARYWHLVIVALTQLQLFLIAKKLFKSGKWALIANFLYLVWQPYFEGYVLWIDTFIPLFLLPGFYFLVDNSDREESKNLFFSGLFLGFGLVFKQTIVPLIFILGLYLLIKYKKLKRALPFIIGVLIPTSLMLLYVYSIGVWEDFFYWTITFNLTTFAQMGRKYPPLGLLIKSIPIFGLSLISILYIWFREKRKEIVLMGIFLIGSIFFAYARFDYIHFQPALPFAILSIVYLLISYIRSQKFQFLVIFLFTAFSAYLIMPFYRLAIGDEIKFFGNYEERLAEQVGKYAREDDPVFAMGTTPHLCYLTKTLPPGRIFVFQFPWFMVEAEERVLDGIIHDPPKVVVRDKNTTTSGINLISYMKNINRYIEDNYKAVDYINGTEIMISK